MREILFRGKRKENSKWVCSGNLIHFSDEYEYYIPAMNDKCYVTHDEADNIIEWNETLFYKVIPETVGQYTGLTDKDGKKIFEGDIVSCFDRNLDEAFTAVVEFGNPNSQFNWGFQLKPVEKTDLNTDILLWVEMEETGTFIKVIGNIHDNPELLKGENND